MIFLIFPPGNQAELLLQTPSLTQSLGFTCQQEAVLPGNPLAAAARESSRLYVPSPCPAPYQCPSLIPSQLADHVQGPSSLSSSISCRLHRSSRKIQPSSSLCGLSWISHLAHPNFCLLAPNTQNNTQDPQRSHLERTQKDFLPGNPQAPEIQRGLKKPKNRTPIQQRQKQISTPRITIVPTQMASKNQYQPGQCISIRA